MIPLILLSIFIIITFGLLIKFSSKERIGTILVKAIEKTGGFLIVLAITVIFVVNIIVIALSSITQNGISFK
jgi:hypothetical protein